MEGGWLTESVINAVQTLLKKSFPHVGRLQPTSLGETLGFAIARGEFIQILNISNHHWLTVCNIECSLEHVNVYDSIHSGDIYTRVYKKADGSHTLHNNNNNTQITAIALPPSTMHPQLWAELLTFKPKCTIT